MPKIKIKNLNTEINRRIKLIKTATSVVDIGQQQGAVVNQSDYVGICLAPLEVPVIGCEGAIPTTYITTLRRIGSTIQEQSDALLGSIYNINGQDYSLEESASVLGELITGETLPDEELPPTEVIPDGYYYHYGNESSGDVSVYTAIQKLTNISSSNLKLDLKAGNDNLINVFWNNPTAVNNKVCMSVGSSTPIGCEGATPTADTGGIWGTSPLMLVNGIGYDGIRSIPDILEFDNQGLETHWKFKNISDEFLKVQINTGAEDISDNDGGWAENTNPTLEVNFETGQVNFCLAPAGACEPTEFVMNESTSFEGGSVRMDYVIDAPGHGISNVSKRFSMTDIQQGTYLSEIVRQVISQIKEDYPFIAIREGTGTQTANFDFWTYRSTVNGSFLLAGVEGVLSKDPITIKFVKSGLIDDLFALIFPDGLTEYSAHSCGSQELVGI